MCHAWQFNSMPKNRYKNLFESEKCYGIILTVEIEISDEMSIGVKQNETA
jgi:hypothetical protein